MKLNKVQILLAEHFFHGEPHYMNDTKDLANCSDTLLVFLINEAHGDESVLRCRNRLKSTIEELQTLLYEL